MTKYAPRTASQALARALSMVGQAYHPGWCQKWTNELFGTGAVGDYDGDRDADAVDGWKKASANGRVVHASAIGSLSHVPAGRMMYWSGGRHGYGHAAISAGNGQIVSTDAPTYGRIGRVPISWVRDHWGLTFLGYVEVEGNGHTLADRPSDKPKPAPVPSKPIKINNTGWWHVNPRKVSTVLKGLTAGGKLKHLRRPNFNINVAKFIDKAMPGGNLRRWAVTKYGTYYAADYLTKGKH